MPGYRAPSSNCLRSGGDCGYGDPFVLEVPAPARDQALPRSSRAVATPLNPLPKHSFVGFPIELPERSRWLLQTCEEDADERTASNGLAPD